MGEPVILQNIKNMSWYEIKNIDEVDSPALLVYPDRIRENVRRMVEMTGSPDRLYPHIKTNKMPEVVQILKEEGIKTFKCATIAEAELLGGAGAEYALLAYQPVGPKIARLARLVQRFPETRFAALADNETSASSIATHFHALNREVDIFLDIDVGQHRTGLPPDDGALALYQHCQSLPGLRVQGLHVYDGHLRDSDITVRVERSNACYAKVDTLLQRIVALTGQRPKVVIGGTPTFPTHARRSGVCCSPGTCVLWDWGYSRILPEQDFLFAALVLSRVISKIGTALVCVDLGHKNIAAEQPFPRVHFLNLPEAQQISQSEEHLVLNVGNNESIQVGQVLYGVPQHVCPTVALYHWAQVVENGRVDYRWEVVARKRQITI